jgi:hypothetical protein
MSTIDKLQLQGTEVHSRLESLRSVRERYSQEVTARLRPAEDLEAIDKRILGAEHRLERIDLSLAEAEAEARCEDEARAAEFKRQAEIEALERYLEWYKLSLQTADARLSWCQARSAVPGDVALPCMGDDACALWAADRLVELMGTELPGTVEIASLAADLALEASLP